MSQATLLVGALAVAFIAYLAINNRLRTYLAIMGI